MLSLRHGRGRGQKFESSGSGVIISPEGYVITNHHVAGKATSIRCVLSTREELEAELVGTDALADIAVIKLDMSSRDAASGPLPIARFGSSEALAVGEPVLAMGCPLAISQSVTRGVVSNKDMMIPKRLSAPLRLDGENVGSLVKWIGHDAGIFPGNSGGPLVNLRGEIVGINEIGLGLGGAIPSELAQPVSRELIEHGRVRRAWVGAGFQPLLKNGSAAAGDQGALVSGVLPGSPSERAGLRAGDILLNIDGEPVRVKFEEEMPGLIRRLLSKPVGVPMQVKVKRGQMEHSLSITPRLRDDARGREVEAREWGMTLRRLTLLDSKELHRPNLKGVLVGSIRPGGAADKAVPPSATRRRHRGGQRKGGGGSPPLQSVDRRDLSGKGRTRPGDGSFRSAVRAASDSGGSGSEAPAKAACGSQKGLVAGRDTGTVPQAGQGPRPSGQEGGENYPGLSRKLRPSRRL